MPRHQNILVLCDVADNSTWGETEFLYVFMDKQMHGKGQNIRKLHNAWKRTEYKKTT